MQVGTLRPRVTHAPFGATPDGRSVEVFTLTNARGIELRAMTYGATILSLRTPDRRGQADDIVLGQDDLATYLARPQYFGALIGRYANRIAYGRFTLDGVTHQLTTNDRPHHLHGGTRGFDKALWHADPFQTTDSAGVYWSLTSPDGDQGFPGSLTARVTYILTDRDELVLDYHAMVDRATPVNLTQHTYWNLAGAGRRDVLDHELTIEADHFTPIDATRIPTGVIAPVAGTPFDFRRPTRIGARIGEDDVQLRHAGGYDHNFVLDRRRAERVAHAGPALLHAARVVEPATGRVLDISTTEPGLQFYSGNFLDGTTRGKEGRIYAHRSGLCLETQHFPDSPNQPHFPSTILRPGEEYRSHTVFTFGVRE